MRQRQETAHASCSCGGVVLELAGPPMASVACYCDDCQEGARRLEALPAAAPIKGGDGGTPYVLYRKDRVRCSKGSSLLKSYKLRKESPTNRVVATCCNSAMFLGFDDSKHWVDVYRSRLQGNVPPLQMRICTSFKPGNDEIPDDGVPSYPGYPFRFVARLIAARIAMLLGR